MAFFKKMDFLGWLFIRSGIDCKVEIEKLIDETMLQKEEFVLATKLYKIKYLSTKYLKIRNPMILMVLKKCRNYNVIKCIYKIESLVKG